MIYENLLACAGDKRIKAGLIGSGSYGISLLSQAQSISRLDIPVVCDLDPERAQKAYRQAGIPEDEIVICSNRKQLLQAMQAKKCAIAEDFAAISDVPLDVIIECTGNPEAGARHAELAIQHGQHVAMVNKETDSVVGPMLSQLADKAGVVYTPVDGDQHGLLIGRVSWARSIGLDVVCGGKARPYDFVYDESTATVTDGLKQVSLSMEEMESLRKIQVGEVGRVIEKRRKIFKQLPQIANADLCESVIVANATGLLPDTPFLHAPIVRTTELPEVLCTIEDGGILNTKGVIDAVTCLRRKDEAGLGGGVFLVFSCSNNEGWDLVKEKGLLSNHRGTCGVVYRPYHLLGVETPISILCAALLKVSTGSLNYKPRVDLAAKATRDLRAGTLINSTHERTDDFLEALILPYSIVDNDNPVPLYMAVGNLIKQDVPAGTILTYAMIKEPEDSRLWELRRQQNKMFRSAN